MVETDDLGVIKKHCLSRVGIKKAETHLNLQRHLKGNKHFYRYQQQKEG